MTDFQQLSVFKLSKGSHDSPEEGVCAMEAVAWLEGLPHSDHPKCTCPVIAAYVRSLNDDCSTDELRQKLISYLPKLVGTVGTKDDELERANVFVQASGEIFAYRALEVAGLNKEAATVATAFKAQDWNAAEDAAAAAAAAAARAADYAAAAAATAAYAAADYADVFYEALAVLDKALAIGPQSPLVFSQPIETRVAEYRELVSA